MTMDKISSGILSLDLSLGGGFPLNKITEVCGPPNSSKTSFILNLIKQNPECVTAYLDVDNSVSYDYLENMEIDTESLVISHPESAEQLIQIVQSLVSNKAVDIIVVDSIATLISKDELKNSMLSHSNNNIIVDTIKKLSGLIYKSDCAMILVNQIRNDLKSQKYGSEIAIADRALNTYATIRLDIRQTNEIHHYDQIIGAKLKISIKKNKIALKKGESVSINHYYKLGLDTVDDLLELAVNANIIQRSGSWYNFGGQKIQGKDAFIRFLRQGNDDLLNYIHDRVIEHYFS
jgi:recombination protein RecA